MKSIFCALIAGFISIPTIAFCMHKQENITQPIKRTCFVVRKDRGLVNYSIKKTGEITQPYSTLIPSLCYSAHLKKNSSQTTLVFLLDKNNWQEINIKDIFPAVIQVFKDEIKKVKEKDPEVPHVPIICIDKNNFSEELQKKLSNNQNNVYFSINEIKEISNSTPLYYYASVGIIILIGVWALKNYVWK